MARGRKKRETHTGRFASYSLVRIIGQLAYQDFTSPVSGLRKGEAIEAGATVMRFRVSKA
jgi:hypothetical protein